MIKIDGFKFSPDPEDVGLDIDIPGFGTWWVDQYWQFVDVPLDELPLHEKFCDEAFAARLNRALDEYIRLVRGDAKSDWFDSHVVVMTRKPTWRFLLRPGRRPRQRRRRWRRRRAWTLF